MNTNVTDELINFDDFPALGITENDNDVFESHQDDNFLENEGIYDPFNTENNDNNFESKSELVLKLLNQKGITDPSKIQVEEEDGSLSEINFNDLNLDEQLEILQYEDSTDLEDSEIDVINYLRENNISLEELITYREQLAIKEYLENNNNTNFTVDSLSDEELFKIDTKSKYDHLTDEELEIELQKELNNPDLFKKKLDKLRDIYKQEEIDEQTRLSQENELEEQRQYEETVNLMVEVAQDTNELFDLELEDEDKEEVLQFLLQRDINGQSEFAKLLNDPKKLFEIAWFAKKGNEAFNTIHDYYKKEIDSARKNNGSSSLTSRKTFVKKENNTKQGDDPYGLNEIFKN